MDTHFIMAHLENAAACPGAFVSALYPLEATRILFQNESYPMAPMTSPLSDHLAFWESNSDS